MTCSPENPCSSIYIYIHQHFFLILIYFDGKCWYTYTIHGSFGYEYFVYPFFWRARRCLLDRHDQWKRRCFRAGGIFKDGSSNRNNFKRSGSVHKLNNAVCTLIFAGWVALGEGVLTIVIYIYMHMIRYCFYVSWLISAGGVILQVWCTIGLWLFGIEWVTLQASHHAIVSLKKTLPTQLSQQGVTPLKTTMTIAGKSTKIHESMYFRNENGDVSASHVSLFSGALTSLEVPTVL